MTLRGARLAFLSRWAASARAPPPGIPASLFFRLPRGVPWQRPPATPEVFAIGQRVVLLRRTDARSRRRLEIAPDGFPALRRRGGRRQIDRDDVELAAEKLGDSGRNRPALVGCALVATMKKERGAAGSASKARASPSLVRVNLAGDVVEPDLMRFEDRAQRVVIRLRDWIGLVVVAFGTADGESEERRGSCA